MLPPLKLSTCAAVKIGASRSCRAAPPAPAQRWRWTTACGGGNHFAFCEYLDEIGPAGSTLICGLIATIFTS
jgi:hypothetical protein